MPTIVVPKDAADSIEAQVLLALGMSPEDSAAIGFGFDEAALRLVPLLAVRVWTGVPAAAGVRPARISTMSIVHSPRPTGCRCTTRTRPRPCWTPTQLAYVDRIVIVPGYGLAALRAYLPAA